jgi:hypothetical protein
VRTIRIRQRQAHANPESAGTSLYDDRAIVLQGVLKAGTAFLQKPFTAEQTSRKLIATVFNRARPRPPAAAVAIQTE